MPMLSASRIGIALVTMAVLTAGVHRASAQGLREGTVPDIFQQKDSGPAKEESLQIISTLTASKLAPGEEAILAISVKLPRDFYIYSTNPVESARKSGMFTKIELEQLEGLEPVDQQFIADRLPKHIVENLPGAQEPIEFDKFPGEVVWYRRFRISENADPTQITVVGGLKGQYCSTGPSARCIRISPPHQFRVALSEGTPPESVAKIVASSGVFPFTAEKTPTRVLAGQERPDPIRYRFDLAPQDARPGDEVTLSITANLEKDWHTFALSHPNNAGKPTVITLEGISGLEPLGKAFVSTEPPKKDETFDGKEQLTHYGAVTWTRKFKVLPSAEHGDYGVRGAVTAQVCNEGRCLPAKSTEFALGDLTNQVEPPLDVAFVNASEASAAGLGLYLLYAFLGGMILNVMPCVLPVLAIKVMSFVQQAGESRGRILALNIAYSAGVIGVFLLLATLAVVLQIGWGGLFQKPEFNLLMACIVFAMGLSLLGVFEIPVPGFVGSAAGQQHQEGLLGAFSTGILATLLATPCSGPFLGATLAWSVRQPTEITYLVWATMGVGMAFPYLLFGLFPGAIRFLPRPGNWMVRFKEFSGFVLMGTVIFIISFLDPSYTIPCLIMLMGIALGLWMVGNLYDLDSHIRHKWTVRLTAFTLTLLICGLGFGMTKTGKPYLVKAVNVALGGTGEASELPWKPFSENELQSHLAENRTVLVDFTADWCLTCKTNEALALNTAETLELVQKHGVVPLYADYTSESEEIKRWLDKFESISVPLTVIFPAGKPDQPIVIRDLYSQRTLLEKLQEAVATGGTVSSKAEPPKSKLVLAE